MREEQDVVVVPVFDRPEMLMIWMDLVIQAWESEDLLYIFCLDYGYDKTYDKILDGFPYRYAVIRTRPKKYSIGKQSFNVLNGLMNGAYYAKELVFYVEEDVFIGKDFFQWHREVHRQQEEIFCSIATRNNNTKYMTDGFLQHYYLSFKPDYQALGTCFKKGIILDHIREHFVEEYFRNPIKYCLNRFPGSIIGKFYGEQDGLIRRIIEECKMPVAFPHIPRGFHGGIYGYNRRDPKIKKMKLAERKQKILDTAFNPEALKRYVQQPHFFSDSEPCDLDTHFDEMVLAPVQIPG